MVNEFEFWKVLTCFGEEQVKHVLQDPQWSETFSDVFQRLESEDDSIRYNTMIPFAMIKAIATIKPYQYAFGFHGNVLKCRPQPEDIPPDFIILSPLEALEKFGIKPLFEAVDYGTAIVNKGSLS